MRSDQETESAGRFPFGLSALFAVVGGLLIGFGIAFWWPERAGASTAQSDLGLTLIGGGLALLAGFLVARAVFGAEAVLGRDLRARDEERQRESRKLELSLAGSLRGADLRYWDLRGLMLHHKDLRGADMSGADLREATFTSLSMNNAYLVGTNLQGARIGLLDENRRVDLTDADLSDADLRNAAIRGDARRANFSFADLRGADLTAARLRDPDIESSGPEVDPEPHRAILIGARYDDATQWPRGFDPESAGARRA